MARPKKGFQLTLIERMHKTSDLLIKYDPEGLIKIGAPKDEYEHEAVEIIQGLTRKHLEDVRSVALLCRHIFKKSFGEAFSGQNYDWLPLATDVKALHE